MRYASVCSGIEAATAAWHPLGWDPVFFSEIDGFPSRLLAHKYPSVPNHGDMTNFRGWPDHAIDLLVGGTPCQSFSVAGLRQGLADPRGNLMLTFGAVAERYRPRWVVWENVPGVLSSAGGRDFGTFLGMLAELGYGFAYRVLDAQYVRVDGFGRAVPQRRRRVFVVGHLGSWRRAAAVLFEPESLRGHTPPRREAGQSFTHATAPCLTSSGRAVERAGDTRGQDPVVAEMIAHDVAPTLNAHFGDKMGLENQHINGGCGHFVAHALRGEGFDASEDGTGRGTPIIPVAFDCKGTDVQFETDGSHPPLRSMGHNHSHQNAGGHAAVAIQERAVSDNAAAGPDGKGWRDDGAAYTLEERQVPQAVAFQPRFARNDRGGPSEVAYPLTAQAGMTGKGDAAQCVAFAQNQRDELRTMDVAGALAADPGMKQQTYLAEQWAVRRLSPTECERLQGFPDGYTDIGNGKGGPTPDGPRYKALGNSMAVNVMRWIGRRIEMVENISSNNEAA